MKRNANAPLTAFFSPDGEWFCTTGDVGTARVFRAEDGERLFATPDTVYGGAFSSNGELLAVFGEERGVHLWDVHHRWDSEPCAVICLRSSRFLLTRGGSWPQRPAAKAR